MSYADKYDELTRGVQDFSEFTPVNSQPEDDPGFLDYALDFGRGVGAGLEGAAQDVWNLGSTLTGGFVPSYDNRFIDRPDTGLGSVTEGIVNFTAGFLPVLGWLGKGAKLGRTLSLAPKLSKAAETAAKARGAQKTAFAIDMTRAATAGAVADFAVWDGHEARLSNMIQQYPMLANPVTEFLQADDDDHEVVGRLKAAVEGIGIGAGIDLLRYMWHFRAGARARAAGATPRQTQAAADAVVPTEELAVAFYKTPKAKPGNRDFSFAELVEENDQLAKVRGSDDMAYAGTAGMSGQAGGFSKVEQLDGIRTLLTNAAKEGEVAREWYEKSGQEILKIAGGNVDEADKIAQLVALFSASTDTESNLEFALAAYYRSKRLTREQFLLKQNTTGRYGRPMMSKAAQILYDGAWYGDLTSGLKTRNFYNDLMSGVDPTRSTPMGATMDMWMARLFGFDPVAGKGGPVWDVSGVRRYDYMLRQTKRVAEQLGWQPHQVQASAWAYAKGLWESMTDEVVEKAAKKGITDRKSVEFGKFYQAQFNKRIRKELGGSRTFKVTETYDLTEVLRKKSIILPDSAMPSRGSGILDEIHTADYGTKNEYLADMEMLRTGGTMDGDVIGEALGFGARGYSESGERLIVSPNAQPGGVAKIEAAAGRGKSGYEPISRAQAESYAMTEGLYHGRNEVQGVQMTPAGSKEFLPGGESRTISADGVRSATANGFEVNFGRLRSDQDLELIQGAVERVFGDRAIAIPTPRGFALVRKTNRLSKGKFVTDARKVLDELELPEASLSGRPILADHFRINSGTADGSGFRKMLEDRGHAKALEQLDDVYGPNVARVQQKYAGRGLGDAPTPRSRAVTDGARQLESGGAAARSFDRNAAELISLDGQPVPTNADGTITLYHRTSLDRAERIQQSGAFTAGRDGHSYFSSTPRGQASGHGRAIVEVRIDPRHVEFDDAFANGEVHVRVEDSRMGNATVVGGGPGMTTPAEMAKMAKTGRRRSSTSTVKVAERLAKDLPDDATILDFGAGAVKVDEFGQPVNYYGQGLVDQGKAVTLYDYADNVSTRHDPDALAREHDMVMASDVVSVQPSLGHLDRTLDQIAAATKRGGEVVINLSGTKSQPAFGSAVKGAERARMLEDMLLERFAFVERVGGTKNAPVLRAFGKLTNPHTGGKISAMRFPRYADVMDTRASVMDLIMIGRKGPLIDDTGVGSLPREATLQEVYGPTGEAAFKYLTTDDRVAAALVQAEAGGRVLKVEASRAIFPSKYIHVNELPDGSLVYMGTPGNVPVQSYKEDQKIFALRWNNLDMPRDMIKLDKAEVVDLEAVEAVTKQATAVAEAVAYRDGLTLAKYGDHLRHQGQMVMRPMDRKGPLEQYSTGVRQFINRLRLQANLKSGAKSAVKEGTVDPGKYTGAKLSTDLDLELSDKRIHLIERFMYDVGEDLFGDVRLSIMDQDSLDTLLRLPFDERGQARGFFRYATGLVAISNRLLDTNKVTRGLVHELWHSLERFVPRDSVARLEKQFLTEQKAWIKANPRAAEALKRGVLLDDTHYRYVNFNEWFVETMTDKTLSRYGQLETPRGIPKVNKGIDLTGKDVAVLGFFRRVFGRLMKMFRKDKGPDAATKIFDDFFGQKINAKDKTFSMGLPDVAGDQLHSSLSPLRTQKVSLMRQAATRPKGQSMLNDVRPQLLRGLGVSEVDARNIADAIDERRPGLGLGMNPRELNEDGSYKYSNVDLLDMHLERLDLNLSNFYGSDEAITVLRTFEDLYRTVAEEDIESLRRFTFEDQLERSRQSLVELIGVTPRGEQAFQAQMMRGIAEDENMLGRINARILAYKRLAITYGEFLSKEATDIMSGKNSDEAVAMLQGHAEFYANLVGGIKGLVAEQGRGLGSGRIPLRGIIEDPRALQDFIMKQGGRNKGLRLAELIVESAKADGVAGVNRTLKATFFRKVLNVTNEYWINSILSGGRTLAVNGVGGVMMSIYRPLETMVGASITLNGSKFADAFSELFHLYATAGDAFKYAWLAMRQGDNILDPTNAVLDTRTVKAISAKALGIEPKTFAGTAVNWTGTFIRIPSSILMGTDEFFKQMNYRAKSRRALVKEGVEAGLTGRDLSAHVFDRMDQLVENGQAYSVANAFKKGQEAARAAGLVDPSEIQEYASEWVLKEGNFDTGLQAISNQALDYAEEITFTRSLDRGSLSAGLQRMAMHHPMLRFIFPFVRTPMNILNEAQMRFLPTAIVPMVHYIGRMALGKDMTALKAARSKTLRQLASGNRDEVAEVAGRLGMAASAATIFIAKAQEGTLTGRGPADPEQRQILKETGWQPYSVKTDQGYVSYSRFDPFATVMGTIADLFDYLRYAPLEEQEQADTVAMGIMVALSNNLTNKTYLAGLANAVEAVQSPDRYMAKLARTYGSSFIPFSSALGQSVYAAGDDSMRDVQSMGEAMRARVPYLSETVRPLRNIFGEPVRRTTAVGAANNPVLDMFVPIIYSEVSDDLVKKEIAELGHGFTPPKPVANGIRLTNFVNSDGQDAFDRWGELTGQVNIGGRTIKSSLKRLIRSPRYQRLSPVSTFESDSPRIQEINKLLDKYKRKAFREMLREYPDLEAEYARIARDSRLQRRGIDPQ